MRNEAEMLDLILRFVNEDERVRAAVMNGSRINPKVDADIFQDYDIVFIVTALDEFVRDRSWIEQFGQLIIMQTPDEHALSPSDRECFAFLMLFEDGNRLDLTLHSLENVNDYVPESLSVSLMDKDGILAELPPPNDGDHRIARPTAKEFSSCCNEFWWVSTYVAKGLWRRQPPYANYMFEHPVRDMLSLMLKWYIGTQTNFTANVGAFGKHFETHLSTRIWNQYLKTFSDANYQHMWESVFEMCDLFREIATTVAERLHYDYPVDDDRRVTDYLRHIRALPLDAEDVFPRKLS